MGSPGQRPGLLCFWLSGKYNFEYDLITVATVIECLFLFGALNSCMKKTLIILAILATGPAFFSACKKKEDPKIVNLLCEGNSSGALFPVATGNVWRMVFLDAGVPEAMRTVLKVGKDSFINSKMYKVYSDSAGRMYGGTTKFLRVEAGTGNVYMYSPGYVEKMELPGNPTLNQTWAVTFYSRKVTNLNASLKTGKCNYTGLVEVTELDGGSEKSKYYYKKGLGLVAIITHLGAFMKDYELESVSLQ